MRKLILYLILSVAFISFSKAQTANEKSTWSLQQCIDYALLHQVKMKNALLDQKSAIAKNKEITALAYPQLKATAGINYAPLVAAFEVPNFIKYSITGIVKDDAIDQDKLNNTPDNLSLAFQPKWTTSPQLEANLILFDPGIMVALQARDRLKKLAEQSVSLTREQLIVAVTKAYYNILIAEKRYDLLQANLTRLDVLEKETREIYRNGLVEKIDVDRITVTLNNLKTEEIRIRQLVSLTYMALKFQLGMPLEESMTLSDRLSEETMAKEALNKTFDVSLRKEYKLQELTTELLSYDLKRYKLAALPSLSMFGNYGYTMYNSNKLFDPADNWQRSALIGTKLSIPLFDGMMRKSKEKQALFAFQKARNDFENVKSALELEKENARIILEANLLSLENQKQNMQLAEDVYNTARIKYKEGVGSSLEIINAESAMKEAQTNYFGALYDVVTSGIDLKKALGLIN